MGQVITLQGGPYTIAGHHVRELPRLRAGEDGGSHYSFIARIRPEISQTGVYPT